MQLNLNSFQLKIPPNGLITYWMYVVVMSLAFAAIAFIVGACSGRVVAKLQPSAHVAAVVIFTTSLCVYWLSALVFSIAKSGLARVVVPPGHEICDLLTLPFSLLPWMTANVGILLGGGLLQSSVREGTS